MKDKASPLETQNAAWYLTASMLLDRDALFNYIGEDFDDSIPEEVRDVLYKTVVQIGAQLLHSAGLKYNGDFDTFEELLEHLRTGH